MGTGEQKPTARSAGRASVFGLGPPSPVPRPSSPLRLHTHPVTLFWWLTACGLVAMIGWVKSVNLLLLVGYGLFTLLAVNGLSARAAVRRVRGARVAVEPGYAGRPVGVAVDVANPGRRPATVTVTDAAGGRRSAWLFAPLTAGTVHRLVAAPVFARRGAYPVGPLLVESGYPFGVVRVSAPLAADAVLRVLPAPGRIDRDALRKWLVRGGAGDGRTRRQLARPTPGTGDVRGVRPLRPGDSPRDIHWRTSARRGSLLVREYDHPDPLDLVLIVDPYLPRDPTGREGVARLEWALGLAMSLGAAWADGADEVSLTLVVPGRPATVSVGTADPRGVRTTFAALADVAGTPDVPAVPPLPRGGRAVRLLCTPRPDSPITAAWRAAGQPVAVVSATRPPVWYVSAEGHDKVTW